MTATVRRVTPADYHATEAATREAFWNHYQPGADEHFLQHLLRRDGCPDYIPELDLLLEVDGVVIGSITYSKSRIRSVTDSVIDTITFGPVSILPSHQGRGYGRQLIEHSIQLAKSLGYPAILIHGDPRVYHRYGFRCAEKWDIACEDGLYAISLMALPLQPDALQHAAGRFEESAVFRQLDAQALEAYDRNFSPKEKGPSEMQKVFEILSAVRY